MRRPLTIRRAAVPCAQRTRDRRAGAFAALAGIAGLSAVSLVGCHGRDLTSPVRPSGPPFAIVAGANVTDTVQAQLLQALVVQVRRADGSPAHGVVVRFQAAPDSSGPWLGWPVFVGSLTGTSFGTFTADLTDTAGRAKALIAMGTRAGPGKVVITVPELALEDTARYTVTPGNAARIVMRVRDTVLYAGSQYRIGASATDRFGNPRPNDVITYAATTSNVSVTDSGAVTSVADGRGAVAVHAGAAVDTAHMSVVPHGTLVYVQENGQRGIAIVNLDGSGYKFLHAISDYSVFPQWSADGASIVAYEGDPGSNARLTITGIDSSSRTALQLPVDTLVGLAWPRFAPDGSIYFGAVTSGVGQVVWQVHADGTGLREVPNTLGNGNYQHPVVSPDGKTLLYDNARSTGGLMALDLASGTTTSIGTGAWPAYSPDGSRIAFISGGRVVVADASGANPRAISPAGIGVEDVAAPSWTADGQWVLVPSSPALLVRLSDLQVVPLPFTVSFFQPSVR